MKLAAIAAIGVTILGNKTSLLSDTPNYDDLFKKYSAIDGLDIISGDGARVLKAIAWKESSMNTHRSAKAGLKNPYDVEGSKSEDGLSYGLMQLRWETADWLLRKYYGKSLVIDKNDPNFKNTVAYLNNPENSIMLAAKLLKYHTTLFDKKNPNFHKAVVTSYNRGAGNILREVKTNIFSDRTNAYWNPYLNFYNTKAV